MKMPCRSALALPILLAAPALAQDAPPLLHPMFQDHGVLQRDRAIAVWGDAPAGESVQVNLGDKRLTARADKDGHWRAEFPPMPAGGPYALSATTQSGRNQRAEDLLVGDVWLCSGQSNMEYPVSGVLGAAGEIGKANDPEMRLLTVEKKTSLTPERHFPTPVQWQPATPQNVRDFSAACYFMARDLRASQKVPIGLIDATWGGTAIDAWRPETALAQDPTAREDLALLRIYRRDPAAASRRFGDRWMAWYRGKSGDAAGGEPWQATAPGDWAPLPSFDPWEKWGIADLAQYNGMLWYRTEVTLTPAQAAKGATLALGPADDMDASFVNGVPVGVTYAWGVPRLYPLAPSTLEPGKNWIAVGVLDTWGEGGLLGTADQRAIRFADGTSVPLAGPQGWRWRRAPASIGDPPHAPWEAIAGFSGIYNAMIAPIGPYGLRGAAWYQGEANAGSPDGYAEKLASMMAAWRGQFDSPNLPFLIAQLSSWGPRVPRPIESGFAQIRDEQRQAVAADAHAALAVTIDLGDVVDIHPANKQDVGHRLARGAEALTYGGKASPSGPWPVEARRDGTAIRIRFIGADQGLVAYSASEPIGFELCGTAGGSCRFVTARLAGTDVLIDPGTGPADRVRFCWGDSPICNLYDGTGLPATPFELLVR
ncbi:sialate O-acetylesterase [Sphingomonas sp. DG1-23]|uniref:sialate O-acetylesterase n=1 Tax=Sphingomonas sp. DG1-23 TaxID=3068316 RepID=UPI00273DC7D5|nr:sialate O-acetylesterase [Sphingomonas sp. DG1-23]MDP5278077.1 sialate O-acetylesterase [Sphingomonas sp. DG1-23]